MKTTMEYLQAAKEVSGIESDYGAAKILGISKQAMHNYRAARGVMDDYTCAKIAEILGIPAIEVISAANAEREKDATRKEFWRNLHMAAARIAACLMLAILVVMGSMNEAEASILGVQNRPSPPNEL